MKKVLYIWVMALLCITTIKAESVKFDTYKFYHNQSSPDQNQFKAAYAIQSDSYVKIDLKSPSTYLTSDHVLYGGFDYHLWLQTSQVEVTLLDAHAEIESIKVTYATKIENVEYGRLNIENEDFTMDFPTGITSHLFSFSQGLIKVNSITVNYRVNHEYGETGVAYYTCQQCGHVDEARKAACADRALHFTAVGGDVTIGMKKTGNPANYLMQYSLDKQNWTTLTLTATTDIVTIPAGQTCYFRHGGDTPIEHMAGNQTNCWSFTMTGAGTIEAGGSVMSMLDIAAQKSSLSGSPQHAFTGLFKDCAKLTVAPELPFSSVSQFCYMYMFAGTGIATAPSLPATTIPDGAYYGMFQDCKNLTTVPALPGTSLSRVAYKDMFHGCENLTSVEIANITSISSDNPFTDWLTGTAVGTDGLLIAPNDMVKNAKVLLPENWQYKQISDFIAAIRQASEGLRGAMLEVATDYITRVSEASDYYTAYHIRDRAIAELAVLKKCAAFKNDDSYTAPEGAGYRLQIITNNDRTYEFQTKYTDIVDYYQQGQSAQDDANALTFVFSGAGNPIETQHALEGLTMDFHSTIEQVDVTVNGTTVAYPLSHLSGIEHFRGTPTVTLAARQDPQHAGDYYTTFYSSLEAYAIPDGVTAYTAALSNDNTTVTLTALENDILPQSTAVLLRSASSSYTMQTVATEGSAGDNNLSGVDVATALSALSSGTYYVLSAKNDEMGFYSYTGENMPANKAYLHIPAGVGAPTRIIWDNTPTGDGIATDMEHTVTAEKSASTVQAQKFVRGDQLFIRRGNHVYDIHGHLITNK